MSNCLVDQYNSYVVEGVNMTVNGALTIGENIAGKMIKLIKKRININNYKFRK